MDILIGRRGCGKTESAIRKSAESHSCIVCRHHGHTREIANRAKKLGLNIPFPITYTEFMEGKYLNITHFIIEDVDTLLHVLSQGALVDMITIREEDNDNILYKETMNFNNKETPVPRDRKVVAYYQNGISDLKGPSVLEYNPPCEPEGCCEGWLCEGKHIKNIKILYWSEIPQKPTKE